MKRNIFAFMAVAVLLLGLVLAGCGSSPSAAPAPVSASDPAQDELDVAVRETSDYLNKNVPKGSRIAILNVQSASPALSDYIIDELIANAVNDKVFVVIDRQQLNLIRGELDFQYSGDVDDDSAQAIGRLIGAEVVISGAVSKYGDMYRMRIRALAVQTAQVQGQFNRNIPEGRTITALMSSSAVGYSTGTAPAPRQTAQVASAPAVPAPVQVIPVQTPAPTTYKIGDKGPAGGWIFFDMGFYLDGWRYLEAAPQDFPTKVKAYVDRRYQKKDLETGVGEGKENTAYLVSYLKGIGETLRAVQVVSVPKYGDYDDWFLPSRDEQKLMYENLKKKGIGAFSNDVYWSSSSYSGFADSTVM